MSEVTEGELLFTFTIYSFCRYIIPALTRSVDTLQVDIQYQSFLLWYSL